MKLKMPESINKDKVFEKTKGVKESILKNPKIKLVKDKIMATKRSKTIFFSGTSILIVLIIAFTVFGGSGDTVTKIPTLTYMQNGDLSERITASGTARPSDTTSVFIELSQKVKTVSVEVGDKVKEGELLITYDIEDTKKELENKVKSAELSLSDAKNNLNSLIKPASGTEKIDLEVAVLNSEKSLNNAKTELKNADISISGAEKKVSDAKTEMEVNKKLLDIGGVSQLEYDTSVQNYQNALANLSSEQTNKIIKENNVKAEELSYEKAKLNLQNGSNKLNDENTAINYKKQKNAVELAEMNLETARRNLEKLTEETYSPIDGTVIESSAVEGELLTDSKAIMKIADLSKIELDAYVSEYDISSVEVGQSVEITSDGIEGKVYTGKVVKIEPQASSQQTISGSETVVPIIVSMDNPDEYVKSGFTFDIEIIVKDMRDVRYIPISALKKDKDKNTFVFTVDEDEKLNKTIVKIGGYSDLYAEVLSGLTNDQKIIETPTDDMEEGKKLSDYATEVAAKSNGNEESSFFQGGMPGGGTRRSGERGGNRGMGGGGQMPGM